jgi:iron complex transport system ATP-binding protein
MRLETESLTVRYGPAGPPVLDGVAMRVPGGCFYTILGPNGSGKSTLLRALMGTLPAQAGTVTLDGRPLEKWTRKQLAREVGVVPQTETVTFPISARDLIAMGRYPRLGALEPESPRDREAVEDALRRCEVAELGDREVGTLSAGEFQRVRIARAIAQEPRAMVLDEPTASLDLGHEMRILTFLRKAADAGMTVVLITHHIAVAARFSDRLLLLEKGRAAAEGPPAAVLDEEILGRVYGWKVAVRTDPATGLYTVTPLPNGGGAAAV